MARWRAASYAKQPARRVRERLDHRLARRGVAPGRESGIYGVVHFENLAAGVVAIDDDDRIALVGQHRYTLDRESWEIPEGVPPTESVLEGIQRELREETGLEATAWRELCRLDLSNSVTDETAVLFVATGLRHGVAAPEPTESLTPRWVPFDEAVATTRDGRITDALSVAGILRLALDRATA